MLERKEETPQKKLMCVNYTTVWRHTLHLKQLNALICSAALLSITVFALMCCPTSNAITLAVTAQLLKSCASQILCNNSRWIRNTALSGEFDLSSHRPTVCLSLTLTRGLSGFSRTTVSETLAVATATCITLRLQLQPEM